MAAAEVRTAWQRAANRCLVQEDAKRAPKLACCPSSTPQNDSGSGSTTTVQDYFIPNIIPNRNSMNYILSPETKWWLQMQPNLGYHKDFICKQLSSLEDEVKSDMDAVLTNRDSLSNDSSNFVATKEDSFLKSPEIVSSVFMTPDAERKVKEMNTKSYSEHSLKIKRATDGCLHKEELLSQTPDPFSLKRPEKTSLDLESPWSGTTKSEPWWRIADKDELSLLVSQKSSQHIENCDLPKPSQTIHVPIGKLDAGICGANEYSDNTSSCGFDEKFFYSGVNMLHQSEKLYSSQAQGHLKRKPPADQTFKNDLSRSNLLDALRHSQTRARKAEMEAQKAHDEKEHIIKLLFRQASHLFAYRQWLQMLQWQNLFLQRQLKDHPISTSVPNFPVLPQLPLKGKHREGRKKQCKICKLALALAVGLGLAGAGLLLGWTIGCLFPPV
ncbi:uncharacterized protein LOC122034611 [Zingiber officinale]|uniref:uncharacterized protein LOC122034611 n=1 Tax=Zingiber officinale TaxID=94328 RepID=UPI001C4D5AB9|nr:uncharacterized protein LOC122034611 [Zingiber officinale]